MIPRFLTSTGRQIEHQIAVIHLYNKINNENETNFTKIVGIQQENRRHNSCVARASFIFPQRSTSNLQEMASVYGIHHKFTKTRIHLKSF